MVVVSTTVGSRRRCRMRVRPLPRPISKARVTSRRRYPGGRQAQEGEGEHRYRSREQIGDEHPGRLDTGAAGGFLTDAEQAGQSCDLGAGVPVDHSETRSASVCVSPSATMRAFRVLSAPHRSSSTLLRSSASLTLVWSLADFPPR
jgi:hypothetical protein